MTEGGGATRLAAHEFPHKLHTVGRPLPGNEFRLIDEYGHEVAMGEVGEIVGRSDMMMTSYYNQPEKTREAEWRDKVSRRFIRTGDIGRFIEDGFLILLDRSKDIIISGGFNIYPSDIEAELMRHEGDRRGCGYRLGFRALGETPVAFVALRQGAPIDRGSVAGLDQCEARQNPAPVRSRNPRKLTAQPNRQSSETGIARSLSSRVARSGVRNGAPKMRLTPSITISPRTDRCGLDSNACVLRGRKAIGGARREFPVLAHKRPSTTYLWMTAKDRLRPATLSTNGRYLGIGAVTLDRLRQPNPPSCHRHGRFFDLMVRAPKPRELRNTPLVISNM